MPIIEFYCDTCDERMEEILPFSRVTDNLTKQCVKCGAEVPRVLFSRTLEPHFYGSPDGWAKPSPTKRYNTKLVSANDGNSGAAG